MTYFIVEAPYEKCFDLFFKDELGYPNFYRMNELLPSNEQYSQLVLVAPYQNKEPHVLKRIRDQVTSSGVKCLPFGDNLESAFVFDENGKLQIPPHFKEALFQAVGQFLYPDIG